MGRPSEPSPVGLSRPDCDGSTRSPSTVNNAQQANEQEPSGVNGVGRCLSPFFFFLIPSFLSLFLPLSPSHATDVFLCRSNKQESTGEERAPIFPRREEYKAKSAYSRCRKQAHLPPAPPATWAFHTKAHSFIHYFSKHLPDFFLRAQRHTDASGEIRLVFISPPPN